jgi:gluconolactonase
MKVDAQGNISCGGSGGIWVIDPPGKHLGTIVTGEPLTTSMAWGDDDWRTLYVTSLTTLARMRLNIPGVPVPASTAG